jgi:hypothetical protein
MLSGCGPGPVASSGGATIRILRPTQDQVLTNHSLAAQVEVTGANGYRLRYFLDGGDKGEADTSITIPDITPGNHRLEVEVLDGASHSRNPGLRAGVDFTVQ